MERKTEMTKPPYSVPSMTEIAALPWNGLRVVSTFSGGGGSCLGYRMAGYRVVWANEFIPAAQETYRLNHPTSILDTRDIRTVRPEEILEATGLVRGELDLFDGSPPCASFSAAGKREAGWGKVRKYSDKAQRTDDLFFEYARILEGLQPKVFVAENVSGLIKGTAKGYFLEILARLKACGYVVKAKLLDAQWLGVPQMRQRLIFIGVRSDLGLEPVFPKPHPVRYVLADALKIVWSDDVEAYWLPKKMRILWEHTPQGRGFDTAYQKLYGKPSMFAHKRLSMDMAVNTAKQGATDLYHPIEPRSLNISELKAACAFPQDYRLAGGFKQRWERLARAVPPVMMSHIAATIRDEILCKQRA